MTLIHRYSSPLGEITMEAEENALTGLWFAGQKYFRAGVSASAAETSAPVFEAADHWLDLYFRGAVPDFTPTLSPQGSAFRKEVWELLMSVPYGQTVTYGELAGILALRHGLASMSAQAVGGAVGHNPISLIVPCHRVVGAGGKLTGYAGGMEKKKFLLMLESKYAL